MKNPLSQRAVALLIALALIVLQVACGKSMKDGEVWKEEVRMMNGELIVIDRVNKYGESGDISMSSGPLAWASIDFEYGGNHIHWEGRGVWPKALQIDSQKRFYIVTTIPYCWAWSERGKPASYYVVFRLEGAKWTEVPVTEIDVDSVFNLAGTSRPQQGTEFRKYVKESDPKYKDLPLSTHNIRIVIDRRPSC